MILRLKVRRAPRTKRSGKMTGVIYVHGGHLHGESVVVMSQERYRMFRKQIVILQKKLYKIKMMAGSFKVRPVVKRGRV